MEVSTEVERPCPMRTRVGVCHRFPTAGFEGVSATGEDGGMAGWGGVGATTAAAVSGMVDGVWEGAVGVGGTTVLVVSGFLFLDWREGGRDGAVGVLGRLGASGAGVEGRVDVLEPPRGGNESTGMGDTDRVRDGVVGAGVPWRIRLPTAADT